MVWANLQGPIRYLTRYHCESHNKGCRIMVERKSELKRRYHRKKKVPKLKAKLLLAKTEPEKAKLLGKILALSPEWVEPAPAK
jgi:hypothetical protein